MNSDIQSLIESLRRGQYEDPTEKIGLLAAALREDHSETTLILALLHAPQIPLRLAAVEACRGREEAELVQALAEAAQDMESRVRTKLAEVLSTLAGAAATEALKVLAEDSDGEVRGAVMKGTAGKPEFLGIHQKALANDPDCGVRLAAAGALGEQRVPAVVASLFTSLASEADWDVQRRCAEIIERNLARAGSATEEHLPKDIEVMSKVERALSQLGGGRFTKLMGWIRAHTTVAVNPQELARFGTDLTALAMERTLPHAYGVSELCQTLVGMVSKEKWRSIALIGEAGTGKSAVVHELVYELAKPENGGWRVLRVSPSDFMAGTHYMGEWETKVRDLVETVKKPRRVLVYVPNLAELSAAGRWSKSDMNVASALASYIEEGSILLLGESTPAEYERGLGSIPSLRRLFDSVVVEEASLERTREILARVREESGTKISDEVMDRLLEVASQYLSHLSRPGNAAALLRDSIAAGGNSGEGLSFRDILRVLSKSTGIPAALLDDSISLQLEKVRGFFEERIMGQAEAVEAVVDLVTLIKSGLTDPGKPFGVFLFTGPTGVGKTELARALAEYIFGDASRLARFDMSEYASPDGFERLIGGRKEGGLLTEAVRRNPFSVVLLDEIEKSHINVFDLCLQIFDAGRLTDGQGRAADFRRSILILTSNVGGSMPAAPLGFGAPAQPTLPEVDKERTLRELGRCFRPEFLNRIDRIVHFAPLSLDVAERIARREVELVLQRSGIARRGLVVDIDPSLLALLVREGYSAHFGARPLKRTVERLCLLPLARAIATGRIADKAVLFLTQHEGKAQVQITQSARPVPKPPSASPAEPLRVAAQRLSAELEEIEPRVRPLSDRKSELVQRTQEPGFYHDRQSRDATFDEIHKLDQFQAWHERVRSRLQRLRHRLEEAAGPPTDESSLREELRECAAELKQFGFVASSRDARDLGDALIGLAMVDRSGAAQEGVRKLAGMYLGLAERRRMTGEVLAEYWDEKSDRAWLVVSGLGAFALLKNESGLHRLDHRYRARPSRGAHEREHNDREVIRVEVLPTGQEPDGKFVSEVKARAQALKPPRERLLDKAEVAVSLFHAQSMRSLEIWASGSRDSAIEKGLRILFAQVSGESLSTEAERAAVIRSYELGVGSRIKDLRSGRSTNRLAQVFKGHLEMFE